MRLTWLTLIPFVLLSGTPLQGQDVSVDSRLQRRPTYQGTWAMSRLDEPDKRELSMPQKAETPPGQGEVIPPQTQESYPNQPSTYAPSATHYPGGLGYPHASGSPDYPSHPPVSMLPPEGSCRHRGVNPHCLQRIKEWACYQPLKADCGKKLGSCGCNVAVPLYLFYLRDCYQGNCHTIPDCACENKPFSLHGAMENVRARFLLFRDFLWKGGHSNDPLQYAPPSWFQGDFNMGHRHFNLPTGLGIPYGTH